MEEQQHHKSHPWRRPQDPNRSSRERRFRRWLAVVVAGLLCAGCWLEDRPAVEPTDEASEMAPPVVVIAVDGLDPTLVRRFAREGRLPTISRLIRGGSFAEIDCVVGTISPVVWTTVATGVSPERHGIPDFVAQDQLVTSSMREVPAFWNILPPAGLKVATLGWMVTWPAEQNSGIMISDRAYWGTFADKIEPPGILDLEPYTYNGMIDLEFLGEFTGYAYDPAFETRAETSDGYAVNYLIKNRLITPYARDGIHTRMAREIQKTHSPDLLALYYRGVDYVSHGFWKFFEPGPFRAAGWAVEASEVAALQAVIPQYYAYLDRQIGEVLETVREDALIILLSDHGFGTALGEHKLEQGKFLSGNHRNQGVLILSGPQVRKQQEQSRRITHFDILPTILFALDQPLARDLEGYPLLQYFTDRFLESRSIGFVDTFGTRSVADSTDGRSQHDEEILNDLRSLGYIQ